MAKLPFQPNVCKVFLQVLSICRSEIVSLCVFIDIHFPQRLRVANSISVKEKHSFRLLKGNHIMLKSLYKTLLFQSHNSAL